jgi:hypothetical protein
MAATSHRLLNLETQIREEQWQYGQRLRATRFTAFTSNAIPVSLHPPIWMFELFQFLPAVSTSDAADASGWPCLRSINEEVPHSSRVLCG